SADEVAENTGFEIAGLESAPATRNPSDEELTLIRDVLDPKGVRNREVK
ncbi:CoA-transferase, partial [Streptomyces sp. SID10244]|nr:CoA-transferase [Streptomyces sp. SID10244]